MSTNHMNVFGDVFLPRPYVTPGQWFNCLLRGPAHTALVSVSLQLASQASLDRAESESAVVDGGDRQRYEKSRLVVLRRYIVNTATRTQARVNVTLTSYKPLAPAETLFFNDQGVCVFQALCEGAGGPVELQGTDSEGNLYVSNIFVLCTPMLEVLTTPGEWEDQLEQFDDEWPKSWLKDKGAKTKTINFTVSLNQFINRKIPLRAKLLYSDGFPVPSQAILHLLGETTLELNEKQKTCELKFRINDVSKNHQSKAFVVVVEPTKTSEEWMAPAVSYPIVVKSKINNRRNAPQVNTEKRSKRDVPQQPPFEVSKPLDPPPPPAVPKPPAFQMMLQQQHTAGDIPLRLSKNSREREDAEKLLSEQLGKMAKLQAKIGETFQRLTELSKQRLEIEQGLYVSFGPPPTLQQQDSLASLLQANSMALPALDPGANLSMSLLMDYKPSVVLDLPNGELMTPHPNYSAAWNPIATQHAAAAAAVSTPVAFLPSSEDDEQDDSVHYKYMEQRFVQIPSPCNKEGILMFDSDKHVVGFFARDSSFNRVSMMSAEWRREIEQTHSKNLIEVSNSNEGTQQIFKIISAATATE